jgi:two-component system CheB/CheR fusion protein
MDTLVPKVLEVQSKAGQWYQMRIQPYRTLKNVIEGAVLTFVEITREKELLEALRESERRNREMLESVRKERRKKNRGSGDG